MNSGGKNILTNFLLRWRLTIVFEVFLFAVGASLCVYLVTHRMPASLITFVMIGLITVLFKKPWKLNLTSVSSYLDSKLESLEYSSGLLLQPWDRLSNLAKLQHLKIASQLQQSIKKLHPPSNIVKSISIAGALVLLGFLADQLQLLDFFKTPQRPKTESNIINFQPQDSAQVQTKAPQLAEQWVTIQYPRYTNVGTRKVSNMDLLVLEGSKLFWELTFDAQVQHVNMQSMGNNYPMTLEEASYKKDILATTSGFYNFKFEDIQGSSYSSDLFSIEVLRDANPIIEVQGLEQFRSFNYDEDKNIQFKAVITDDYGISDAHIVATVSKGSGESVKFREEKLPFEGQSTSGSKKLVLSKKINLDAMEMEPGDELYFYIETADYKTPSANISRSETFFAVIKDTTSYEFGVEGTLGVDRMPDYFRSQRQLIIDTEKLLRNRKSLSKKDFNFQSNELGYDQKALRTKYGAFMGEESEIAIAEDEGADGDAPVPEFDSDDPLAEYTHDHDSENEHNLVETKSEDKDKDSKNPLQEYIHDHGDPEMATLFEESLKAKLLKALSEMWDAELHLRLYDPEKSLPYQYKALKLIQEIKNSARIYVHRIGFDPPPIKEDKRLTGELDEVFSFRKSENIQDEEVFPSMKLTITRLGELLLEEGTLEPQDITLFEQAGNELSAKAIESPGKYLKTLQQLKNIIERTDTSKETLKEVQNGLLMALPKMDPNPDKSSLFMDEINLLLLKELDVND